MVESEGECIQKRSFSPRMPSRHILGSVPENSCKPKPDHISGQLNHFFFLVSMLVD